MNELPVKPLIESERCGKLLLAGHYSNLSHVLLCGPHRVPATYRGLVADAHGSNWHAFWVAKLGLFVFGRSVDARCDAHLSE